MKPQTPTASKVIKVPADIIYSIIADYRKGHPLILPKPYFLSLEVEEGGFGAGTIVNFEMRMLGQKQSFHSIITEPEPGRLLIETDTRTGIPTSFYIIPEENDDETRVTITTELKGMNIVEGLVAKIVLQGVYRQELDLLAEVAEERSRFSQPSVAKDL